MGTNINIAFISHGRTVRKTLSEVIAALGIDEAAEKIGSVAIEVERGKESISASTEIEADEYAGIIVDGKDSHGQDLYLGNFELPTPDWPGRIAARLYAGYAEFESDAPITIVTHDIRNEEKFKKRCEKARANPYPPRKLVYIDHEMAGSRTWRETGEKNMPEHEEDEYEL